MVLDEMTSTAICMGRTLAQPSLEGVCYPYNLTSDIRTVVGMLITW